MQLKINMEENTDQKLINGNCGQLGMLSILFLANMVLQMKKVKKWGFFYCLIQKNLG